VTGSRVEADGMRLRYTFGPATSAASLVAEVARRAEIRDIAVLEPSIEDLVRTLYAGARPGG
jgi:ABC-2 type transport system ATP-binding protein